MAENVEGWTHACLRCNATWKGDASHACTTSDNWRRDFWRALLAMRVADAELDQLVDQPIARARLVTLLGASWATDDLSAMPKHTDTPTLQGETAKGALASFDRQIPRAPAPRLHGEKPTAAARRAAARKSAR